MFFKKMLTKTKGYSIIFLACETQQCASGSVVEHLLAKEGVAGSIPVSRFFYCLPLFYLRGSGDLTEKKKSTSNQNE